jgi:hypothetical protein
MNNFGMIRRTVCYYALYYDEEIVQRLGTMKGREMCMKRQKSEIEVDKQR